MRGYNSTIVRKMKKCSGCGLPKFIFSRGRCVDCARIEDAMKRMEKETDRLIEDEDLSSLIEDADTVFSRFIRLKYANENGIVKCYTCDTKKHWTMMQNGHFVGRANLFARWDERNCRPQCSVCNEVKRGNLSAYRENLDKENYGVAEYLLDEMKLVYKPTRDEIRSVISEYSEKVKQLKSKLKSS